MKTTCSQETSTTGICYRFTLSDDREDIEITNNTYVGDFEALSDNQADTPAENQPMIFGQGFGGITDIKVGPDGYLYVLGLSRGPL